MSLQDWADNGWLRAHTTSAEEVGNLLAIVDRDLVDASRDISADWQFGIAYNAALKLCRGFLIVARNRRSVTWLQTVLFSVFSIGIPERPAQNLKPTLTR